MNNNKHSMCNPACIVQGKHYRFSVLTPQMLRMEYSESGIFEDLATQTVLNRNFSVPEFTVTESDQRLEIDTKAFHMVYNKQEFNEVNLFIDVKYDFTNYGGRWYFGTKTYGYPPREHNLKGTARTLDRIDGELPLDYGLMDKSGRTFFDDSNSFVIDEEGNPVKRLHKETDVYYLAYGRDYFQCIHDFYLLSGAVPLLPRYALGNWWSRYWKYSEDSYTQLLTEFENRKIPFTVAVMDMDWHIVNVPMESGGGWTGYTWNRELFPNPAAFLEWVHKHGYHVTLNVHPASGVRSFEEMYTDMAQFMGINPESNKTIEFDLTNKEFITAYFKFLHHPREKEGVDFWWIDWQQGSNSVISGLDPLWLLNCYHFHDMEHSGKRGLILSRYSGLGSHRYPLGFSGDTIVSWESLAFQPYFTATASNVGYTWWSHDIGGHMNGYKDNELAVRWYQFGVFSPINRLHSSSNLFCGKETWNYPEPYCSIMEDILRFRHCMIPYLYTLNYRCHTELVPVIIPVYYYYPFEEMAYLYKNQYFLGSELLVCPITVPCEHSSCRAGVECFIPKGLWTDIFTGDVYNGGDCGKKAILNRSIQNIPVLAKSGAIVPLSGNIDSFNSFDNLDHVLCNSIQLPDVLDVLICPGGSNTFSLYEDEGDGFEYQKGVYALTCFTLDWNQNSAQFSIHVKGDTSILPKARAYRLLFRGFGSDVTFSSKKAIIPAVYDAKTHTWTVTMDSMSYERFKEGSNFMIQLATSSGKSLEYSGEWMDDRIYDFLLQAQINNNTKRDIYNMFKDIQDKMIIISNLMAMQLEKPVFDVLMEYLTQ